MSEVKRSHRSKPSVRVHTTWPNHPRYGRAYDDIEIRGVILGIWIMAHRAHVSKTDDWLSLSSADLCAITTRSRPVDAAKVTRRACEALAYELRMTAERPTRWLIHVRNFTKKQGFAGRDAGELAPSAPPSVSVSVSVSESEEEKKEEDSHESSPPSAEKPAADEGTREPQRVEGSVPFPDQTLLASLKASRSKTLRELATPKLAVWWARMLEKFDGIAELYLDEQLKLMDLWLLEHPERQKTTLRGAQAFVRGWLTREEPRARVRASQLAGANRFAGRRPSGR